MPAEFGLPFGGDQATAEEAGKVAYPRTSTTLSVSFLTREDQLEEILPEGKGLELRGEPVVTVSANYNVGDLRVWGGRSYDLIVMSFPVTFRGKERNVAGDYAPIIWENLTDPIITGRELIGWSKVYADIEPLRVTGRRAFGSAGWYGFKFLDFAIDGMRQLTEQEVAVRQEALVESPSEGSIHHKYIRRTGTMDQTDADYLTMSTNKGAPEPQVKSFEAWTGEGAIEFHAGSWRDLPMTLLGAVNAFADLEVKRVSSAVLSKAETLNTGAMGETVILE
jgi:hypothetical protein